MNQIDRNWYNELLIQMNELIISDRHQAEKVFKQIDKKLFEDSAYLLSHEVVDNKYDDDLNFVDDTRTQIEDFRANHNLAYDDVYDSEEEWNDEDEDIQLDIVSSCLIESAIRKINFQKLLDTFSSLGTDFVKEEIILHVIYSRSEGVSISSLGGRLLSTLLLSGYKIDINLLNDIIESLDKDLKNEIFAAKMANSSLEHGAEEVDVVAQISQLLS